MFFASYPLVSQGSGGNGEGGDDIVHGSALNSANLSS